MNSIVRSDIDRIVRSPLNWEKLNGKTVLVTGATGFIGSHLIFSLLEHNVQYHSSIRVLAMVRSVEKAEKLYADYLSLGYLDFLVSDVTVPVSYDGAIDYVIHCASNAAPDQYAKDPVGTMKTNFYGTLNLLELAKVHEVCKFLYVSTIEVYGKTSGLELIGEEDFGFISSSNLRSCYPESKKCCENLTVCYGSQYGLDISIGRLSYIYGAGMSPTDSKVCAMIARQVAKGEDIVLKSAGSQLRSYTYVSDAISGLLTVLTAGDAGEAYNIASSTSRITIADMAKKTCALMPEQNAHVRFELPDAAAASAFSFIENAVLDSDKLEGLGWHGEVTLEQGLTYAVLDHMEYLKQSN